MKQSYTVIEIATILGLGVPATKALAEKVLDGPRDLFTFDDLSRMRGAGRPSSRWGQSAFDFRRDEGTAPSAEWFYERACAMEESSPHEAIDGYIEAVAANPMHADAHVNLGRLLHTHGRLREAEAHYVAALVARGNDGTATFNLAVVLEDMGRHDEAIVRYTEAIRIDGTCVDAYFNLSRLYEKKGEKLAAIRHLKDYRRLSRA